MEAVLNRDQIIAGKVPLQYNHPGIYFLLRDNVIVYVGQSNTSVISRIADHTHDKDFDSFYVLKCSADQDELNRLEAEYIFQFCPKYNSFGRLPPNPYYKMPDRIKKEFGIGGWAWRRLVATREAMPNKCGYYDIRELGLICQEGGAT